MSHPPRWIDALLERLLTGPTAEAALGDLHEFFAHWTQVQGPAVARWRYLLAAISLLRLVPRAAFSLPSPSWHLTMLLHYLRISLRHLARQRAFTFVNLFGLTLGLVCGLLIYTYVQHERHVDAFHADADRIFRVIYTIRGEVEETIALTPNIVMPLARREFPEVVDGVRVYAGQSLVRLPDQRMFEESQVIWADSTFFSVFSFGEAARLRAALTRPRTVVLTESLARKYYGNTPPVGQLLFVGNDTTAYQVTGLIPDVPARSHLQFDLVISFYSLGGWANREETFSSANYFTYLKLRQPEDREAVLARIPPVVARELGAERAPMLGFDLQPLPRVHLYSSHIAYHPGGGDMDRVYFFGLVAVLILLIAGINYVNLSTARAVDRAREVGLRKVVGARQGQLITQFMGEAVLLTLVALLLAAALVPLLLPAFGQLVGRELSQGQGWERWGGMLAIGGLVAFLGGAYPALVLSRYLPVKVLRGSFHSSRQGIWLRQGLVVFQFVISILLIGGAIVVQRQLDFVQHKKLGYDREHLVVLPLDRRMQARGEALKAAITQLPGVAVASACTESPHQINGGYSLSLPGESETEARLVRAMAVDEDFVPAMGLQVVAGTNFLPGVLDREGYFFLLNEAAVAALGWTAAEAIGRQVDLNGRQGLVQGVVRDFHLASLREEIVPLVLFNEQQLHTLLLRLAPGDVGHTLEGLGQLWAELVPHRPFAYAFVDEQYAALYAEERRMGRLFSVFAFLAIAIACLGLLGLAAYVTLRRTKEIGIRKVLGATAWHIVRLLSGQFTLLVGIAFVVAAPLSWYLMQRWLMGFAYKVPVGWSAVLLSGLVVLALAWGTVGYQSWRAALANPADSLRDE